MSDTKPIAPECLLSQAESLSRENEKAQSELSATICSVDFWITADELIAIHDLAQRVLLSRQNVGTPMKEQAQKVKQICKRVNTKIPPNADISHSRD